MRIALTKLLVQLDVEIIRAVHSGVATHAKVIGVDRRRERLVVGGGRDAARQVQQPRLRNLLAVLDNEIEELRRRQGRR